MSLKVVITSLQLQTYIKKVGKIYLISFSIFYPVEYTICYVLKKTLILVEKIKKYFRFYKLQSCRMLKEPQNRSNKQYLNSFCRWHHIIHVFDNKALLFLAGGPRLVLPLKIFFMYTCVITENKLCLTVLSFNFITHILCGSFQCVWFVFFLF